MCCGQITQSTIDKICPLAIPKQISTISMHISSLVKIIDIYKSYRTKMKIQMCHGQTTLPKIDKICPSAIANQIFTISMHIQFSSGKRTKKLFTPNIGVSRTSQKHSESNRVNVIFGGHHLQVRRKYVLCEVMRSYSEW